MLRFAALGALSLALLVAPGGCSSTTKATNPCQGVTCSGHGTCASSGPAATCTCENGYVASGLACLATSGPCAGVSCSGHGSCAAAGTTATCTCDSGYAVAGLTCVAASGPCQDVGCSGHGTCTVVAGAATCTCDTGYAAAGLNCVATSGPCAGVTCSGHGACTVVAGAAACTCDSGYGADGLTCVALPSPCDGVTCSGHGTCSVVASAAACTCDPGYVAQGATTCVPSTVAAIGGCQMFPADHIFNTPINTLPVDANSDAYLTTIGAHHLHLDLGQTTDMTSSEYYGIPYNVTHGNAITWTEVSYSSTDPDMSWDPTDESDCAVGSGHTFTAPCIASAAPHPLLPIPAAPLVEGGIDTDPSQPYGDHHMLIVDQDTCRLWELYHCYPASSPAWDIFGSASWDLGSDALRPDGWTSADAAGFPMLALLLRADEASTGEIRHALRFTIQSSKIRNTYVWPARHLTTNGDMSTTKPPMGQLFRLKASYQIPAGSNAQTIAILTAMQTYGMYIADGGSDMYVTGDPSAAWLDDTFSQVQAVDSSQFEAVDLTPIHSRTGFDANSAAVPPP